MHILKSEARKPETCREPVQTLEKAFRRKNMSNNEKQIKCSRLGREKSPYLLQHAQNPVDWYPWCEEAFETARKRDLPIFLSIGYSACHWCHVMAHESFEDEEVAEILNKSFVAVKVDREERPDIDAVYMAACQALTGTGGWPLTVIMTPDQKPFFAGTYFPKKETYGRMGLIEILMSVEEIWKKDRQRLIEQGMKILSFIKKQEQSGRQMHTAQELQEKAGAYFRQSFDSRWGGFGTAPKFPSPHNLLLLMEEGTEESMHMAQKTLEQMYRGGIFDHIGGGFCRYSTDKKWLVPHFEKMLYDQALLLLAYAQGYVKTGRDLYIRVADSFAEYVKRELTHDKGAFFSSQDADSEGEEGKYYVFSKEEILRLLGREEGQAFCRRFDITDDGNFEGKSIPNRITDPAYSEKSSPVILKKLLQYRRSRVFLHRDDKILTSWNGLMIAAFAAAGRKLDRPAYIEMAQQAEAFIWENLHEADGKLLARWREGEAAYLGTLEDYAFFAWALLECYAAAFEISYLTKAVSVAEVMLEQFFDKKEGGCFLYGKDSEQLVIRPKEIYDGAIPSGNAAACLVMGKLAFYTGEAQWADAWKQQCTYMKKSIRHPAGHSFFLWSLYEEAPQREKLICVSAETPPVEKLRKLDLEVLVKTKENQKEIEKIHPALKEYPIPAQGTKFYLCRGYSCSPPVSTIEELKKD